LIITITIIIITQLQKFHEHVAQSENMHVLMQNTVIILSVCQHITVLR